MPSDLWLAAEQEGLIEDLRSWMSEYVQRQQALALSNGFREHQTRSLNGMRDFLLTKMWEAQHLAEDRYTEKHCVENDERREAP